MAEKAYMVQQVIKYSDGSETVINYRKNEDSAEIEQAVAEATEDHNLPEEGEATASESDEVGEVTRSSN